MSEFLRIPCPSADAVGRHLSVCRDLATAVIRPWILVAYPGVHAAGDADAGHDVHADDDLDAGDDVLAAVVTSIPLMTLMPVVTSMPLFIQLTVMTSAPLVIQIWP